MFRDTSFADHFPSFYLFVSALEQLEVVIFNLVAGLVTGKCPIVFPPPGQHRRGERREGVAARVRGLARGAHAVVGGALPRRGVCARRETSGRHHGAGSGLLHLHCLDRKLAPQECKIKSRVYGRLTMSERPPDQNWPFRDRSRKKNLILRSYYRRRGT